MDREFLDTRQRNLTDRIVYTGAGGYILYLVEADTNGDGAIDFRDENLVRAVQPAGRDARTLGQGQSAVWAPDGRYAAIVHDANILTVNLDGQTAPLDRSVQRGNWW